MKSKFAQSVSKMKNEGVQISSRNILKLAKRNTEENALVISEGEREQNVLRMKAFYKRTGMTFPPTKHPNVTICHLINVYYGKEVCKHTPTDNLEKLIKRKHEK